MQMAVLSAAWKVNLWVAQRVAMMVGQMVVPKAAT